MNSLLIRNPISLLEVCIYERNFTSKRFKIWSFITVLIIDYYTLKNILDFMHSEISLILYKMVKIY